MISLFMSALVTCVSLSRDIHSSLLISSPFSAARLRDITEISHKYPKRSSNYPKFEQYDSIMGLRCLKSHLKDWRSGRSNQRPQNCRTSTLTTGPCPLLVLIERNKGIFMPYLLYQFVNRRPVNNSKELYIRMHLGIWKHIQATKFTIVIHVILAWNEIGRSAIFGGEIGVPDREVLSRRKKFNFSGKNCYF